MEKFDANRYYSNIRFLCHRRKMSISDLSRIIAKKKGINGDYDVTLYKDLKLGTTPNIDKVIMTADALGVSLDDLIFTDYTRIEKEIEEAERKIEELRRKLGATDEELEI